jgi:hypothetical protein
VVEQQVLPVAGVDAGLGEHRADRVAGGGRAGRVDQRPEVEAGRRLVAHLGAAISRSLPTVLRFGARMRPIVTETLVIASTWSRRSVS